MLRKHMAVCLTATALMAAPALAQTSPAPAPSASSGAAAGKFMTQQSPNQWRASKLVGVNIYGTDNAKIGDVNDVLLDQNGNAEAVVIGVGGFLGIGEKDVAVPFKAVEWKMTPDPARTSATTGPATTNTGPGTGTTGTTASSAPPATGPATNTTGTTAGTAANRAAADMNRGYPDHGVLHLTKADLQNAPTFRYAGSTAGAGMSTTAPVGDGAGPTAPAPANPPAGAPRR
jgi:sporulation protein YlmC with PRC-barrel domain